MTFLLCSSATLLIAAGVAALVSAIRTAPEGLETADGFSARPVRRPVRSERDDHAVAFPGSAVLH